MEWFFRFSYPWLAFAAVVAVLAALFVRLYVKKAPRLKYALADFLLTYGSLKSSLMKWFLFIARLILLGGLALLIGKPQLVDQHSKITVEGIDIMLVLDVSGSMQLFDDLYDKRTRIDIAKQEAVSFIKKRNNDPIGLVLFGNQALSRCPLTLDKKMLVDLVQETTLGLIDPNGTMLTQGLVMALNRLRKSDAATKIIILLTDGEPSEGDFDPQMAVELARKFGVKIYTIGLGSDEGAYFEHPIFGIQQVPLALNKKLLSMLATQTGGVFFEAKKPKDLATIYQKIDALEKTKYETDMYQKYHDIFMPFVWILFVLLVVEVLLARFWWRMI